MSLHVSHKELVSLQAEPRCVRNICVLAHVDHGKTTLSDNLIASNGLIHPKLVGKLRYLDSREDEQVRGVTMKSSSISLLHRPKKTISLKQREDFPPFSEYLINLIDSPGHVDFCSEVSTAARLSDGALVLVDACEGVHIQTHAVLRQAWEEMVQPVLVINKVDRLIIELKLTPVEAYERLKSILMEVNNIISAFRSEKYISDVNSVLTAPEMNEKTKKVATGGEGNEEEEEAKEEDEDDLFIPEKGNVAFASAMDGWSFTINHFANLYASKMGGLVQTWTRGLWGDYYFHPKQKRIVGKKSAGKLKPMFAQFILEPIWQVYDSIFDGDRTVLDRVIKSMNLNIPPKELKITEPKALVRSIMTRWLPLSDSVLDMVVQCLPDPTTSQPNRLVRLLPKLNLIHQTMSNMQSISQEVTDDDQILSFFGGICRREAKNRIIQLESDVECCRSNENTPCVIFVSKMIVVSMSQIPRKDANGDNVVLTGDDVADFVGNRGITGGDADVSVSNSDKECFLAFARVFSGKIRQGQKIFVLGSMYDPLDPDSYERNLQEATVESLYMMMGQGLEPMAEVPAGNVLAIRGLATCILKSATLSSTPLCYPFASMTFQSAPIVRVAIEPSEPSDMEALEVGLRLLNRADPNVEVLVSRNGEHVIGAAGEVHLERCIKDLQDRFARVPLLTSPPLVAFRETIKSQEKENKPFPSHRPSPPPNLLPSALSSSSIPQPPPSLSPWVAAITPNGRCHVKVHVMRIPLSLTSLLDENADFLRSLLVEGKVELLRGKGRKGHGFGLGSGSKEEQSFSSQDDPLLSFKHRLLSIVEEMEAGDKGEGRKDTKEDVEGDERSGRLAEETWKDHLSNIWALGPRRFGPNLLLLPRACYRKAKNEKSEETLPNATEILICGFPHVSSKLGLVRTKSKLDVAETSTGSVIGSQNGLRNDDLSKAENSLQNDSQDDRFPNLCSGLVEEASSLEGSVISGFQLAASAGPLCEEPMWGLAFTIEATILPRKDESNSEDHSSNLYGPFSGQIITTVKEACKLAVMANSPRMVEAMYFCEVSTTAEALGQVYAVLGRRRAVILQEDLREGSATFTVHAHLPVAESFGFSHELRRKTSGAASPQLVLSHWSAMEEDPFFIPKTEEEIEEFGDGVGLIHNTARKLMDSVRKRKGLAVEEKVVEVATKQRTLARKV